MVTWPEMSIMSVKKHLHLLSELSSHPIAHNIEWSELIPALASIGLIHTEKNGKYHFERHGHSIIFERSHHKVLDLEEVLKLRHFLLESASSINEHDAEGGVIVAIDYHRAFICHNPGTDTESRLYVHADLRKGRKLHVRPTSLPFNDSHPTVDGEYFGTVIKEIMNSNRIVILGHGTSSSNASAPLLHLMNQRYPELMSRVVAVMRCDLEAMTEEELIKAGTKLLTNANDLVLSL
jgi:hypothetical protein